MKFPDELPTPAKTGEQAVVCGQITQTFREYLKTVKSLLDSKYAQVRELLPPYMAQPGNVLVACCSGGIVLRYERRVEGEIPKLVGMWSDDDISTLAAACSQKVVRCHGHNDPNSTSDAHDGVEFRLWAGTPGDAQPFWAARLEIVVALNVPENWPPAPAKPFCACSVHNQFEIGLEGETAGDKNGQRFVTRTPIRLPVGWDWLELYPNIDLDRWKPEYGSLWAETDILGAIVARQLRETHFTTLDPNAAARKKAARILGQFKDLLDSAPDREEILQRFLSENPTLVVPEFARVWPKLRIGKHVTDFVFRDAVSDYVLVELEKSTNKLFRQDGHRSDALNVAIGQIEDWKRYLEDNLATAQRELDLAGISTNPRSLIIIGRSKDLSEDNRRKLATIHNQQPKLRILTYDDLYENAKSTCENLLGPVWEPGGDTHIYWL